MKHLEVFSAGTKPAVRVHPMAIKVMNEAGIDISKHHPKNVDEFLNDSFDYVITVCDDANEACPFFYGKVRHRLHISFEDPAKGHRNRRRNSFCVQKSQEIEIIKNEFYTGFIINELPTALAD